MRRISRLAGLENHVTLRDARRQGNRMRVWRLSTPRLSIPRRLRLLWRDPVTVVGLAIVVVGVMGALAAPVLAPHDPTAVSLEQRLRAPDRRFPLGTDHLGRDELSRLLGLVDLLLAFPPLILAVAIAGTLGPNLMHVMIAVATIRWASYARLIRGMVLTARERAFVEAAQALGASDTRIMIYHIVSNILGPIVVLATLEMGWIIVGIAGLNFLGLGVQPPTPEWGAMLNDGRPFLQSAPQLLLYPAATICLVVLGFKLLGDGVRDVLDPTAHGSAKGFRYGGHA